jgi:uncharacterized surface protein with fasciclin (FAS1) repeats
MGPARYVLNFSRVLIAVFLVVGFTLNVAALAGGHKSAPAAAEAPGTIVDVAVEAGSFTTLVAALQAADLVEALQGEGPFTVFAPTDEAFAALPDGTLEMLLQPENQAQLQAILLYHVVPGKVLSTDLNVDEAVNAETLQGDGVAIVRPSGWSKARTMVSVNSSKVTSPDVAASNGVIHVIDAVLLPPEN